MDENPINKNPVNDGPLNSFGKVAGINLGVMLLYSIFSLAANPSSGHDAEMGVGLTMLLLVSVHCFVLLVVSIILLIAGKKSLAIAGFLSLPVVLLVGFGTCIGLTSVV